MKKDIHPEYRPVVFMDTTTGYKFLSGSTKYSNETVEFEGETYPLIRVEISSDSHPFYTGRQKFTQADGRVDRFNKKVRSQIRNQSKPLPLGSGFSCPSQHKKAASSGFLKERFSLLFVIATGKVEVFF